MKHAQMAYGIHAVLALLSQEPWRVKTLFLSQENITRTKQLNTKLLEIANKAKANGIATQFCAKNKLTKLTEGAIHQGVLAYCETKKNLNDVELYQYLENRTKSSNPLILILEGVQDPHNLGACFRIADATGVDAIIVPHRGSVKITGGVKKVACGADECVPLVVVNNIVNCINSLKELGFHIVGTSDKGKQSLFSSNLNRPAAFVIGFEGSGVKVSTMKLCDDFVFIPMNGETSSLNLSVATGICLYEFVRQNKYKEMET